MQADGSVEQVTINRVDLLTFSEDVSTTIYGNSHVLLRCIRKFTIFSDFCLLLFSITVLVLDFVHSYLFVRHIRNSFMGTPMHY